MHLSKEDLKKERIAVFVAFVVLLIELVIFTIVFKEKYKDNDKLVGDTKLTEIDLITIVTTLILLATAIVHWSIFYQGILKNCYPSVHVRTHATEAFLMYTMLYMFGIGLLMPLLKYFVYGQHDFTEGLYSMYPLVFISMLFGYYLYENIKLNL